MARFARSHIPITSGRCGAKVAGPLAPLEQASIDELGEYRLKFHKLGIICIGSNIQRGRAIQESGQQRLGESRELATS